MSLPTTTLLPTSQGTLYSVPVGRTATLASLHVTNQSGAPRTFTIYLKPGTGTARPISPVAQALAVGATAIYVASLTLAVGCSIEGIADATDVGVVITGTET